MNAAPKPSPAIAEIMHAYPKPVQAKLLELRRLIYKIAEETEGVGTPEETVRWGQTSYLTSASKSGSMIRMDRYRKEDSRCALYFLCQTTLVDSFKEMFGNRLAYEGNRAVILDVAGELNVRVISQCIEMALTYNLRKRG
jgi:hypothetical protein